MSLAPIDVLVFVAFYGLVLGVSLSKSRGRKTSEDYFLGGRQLPWWLIGVSIVAPTSRPSSSWGWPDRRREASASR